MHSELFRPANNWNIDHLEADKSENYVTCLDCMWMYNAHRKLKSLDVNYMEHSTFVHSSRRIVISTTSYHRHILV